MTEGGRDLGRALIQAPAQSRASLNVTGMLLKAALVLSISKKQCSTVSLGICPRNGYPYAEYFVFLSLKQLDPVAYCSFAVYH